ncbi:MAG: voltage-gated sodium channel [Cyclobacteriaceae bacterium]|jgi:voltage-gated sodium channel
MIRARIKNLLEKDITQHSIVGLIILNSVLIGLETSPSYMKSFGYYIDQIDRTILFVFVLEILLKLYTYRLEFFKDSWNIFDSLIVLISITPSIGASFAVLRALRILRTLRLLKNIPKLKIIIEALLHAIPSIGWIGVLLVIVFYIFAVIGTTIFGVDHPEYFGSLMGSVFTLFQIMTLESWASGIARPIISSSPLSVIYFVVFILIATYTTLNIFIAIVVNTMNELHQKSLVKEEEKNNNYVHIEQEFLLDRMDNMHQEIKEMKELLIVQQKGKTKVDFVK